LFQLVAIVVGGDTTPYRYRHYYLT